MPETRFSHSRVAQFSDRRRLRAPVFKSTALVLLASMLMLSIPGPVLAVVVGGGIKESTKLVIRTEAGLAEWFGSLRSNRAQKPETPTAPAADRGVTVRPAPSKEENEARTASIKINPSGSVVLHSRQPMLFAAIPVDTEGSAVHGLPVNWESSDTQVLFIKKGGEAIAGKPGTATITARAGSATASASVTVVEGTKENFGGKKKQDSTRPPAKIGLKRDDNKRVAIARKTRLKRQHAPSLPFSRRPTFADAEVAPFILPLRPPAEDPLPDNETGSLYQPANNVGMPPGKTRPGGSTPAVAAGGIETGNKNFTFGLPIVDLPGRGLNVSLGLTYNSLLYNKSTDPSDNSTWLTYDVDSGYPAPGFRLGYGQIEDQGSFGFTLTEADGTRHALTYTSAYNYDSNDGSFIHFNGGSGWGTLSYPDGTRVSYGAAGGGYRSYPTRITDRNGNYFEIHYVQEGGQEVGPRISSIKDTLERHIRFYYASNGDLVTITAPAMAGQTPSERQVMRFYYDDITFNASTLFSSSVNPCWPNGSNSCQPTTSHVIKHIYLSNSVESTNAHLGYRFDYSAYGMIYQITQFRGMTVSSTSTSSTGSISNDGTQAAITIYNYPGTPVNSTTGLSDVPSYTTRTDDWAGRTTGMNGNPATAPYYTFSVDESTGVSIVTAPNSAVTETHAIVHPGFWDDGLISESFLDKQGSTALSHSVMDWEQGAGGTPRVYQVRATDEAGQTKATVLGYTGSSYNNITSVSERDFTDNGSVSSTVLRRTETTYVDSSAYTSRNLIHLPAFIKVFPDGSSTIPISRVDYAYDNYGTNHANLVSRDDIVMHDPAFDPFQQTQEINCHWDDLDHWVCDYYNPYEPPTDYRGNVTSVTTYSDAPNQAGEITHATTYDIAGNVMTAQVDCCQTKTFSYTDNPNTHTYAYPTSVVSGNPSGLHLTTSMTYDSNTGLVGTATDENGQVTTLSYNTDSLRLDHVTSPGGASAHLSYSDTLEADPNSKYHYYVQTQTKLDLLGPGGTARYITSRRYFDGRDAVARTFDNFTAADGYSTQDIEYDVMGRVYRSSNPYFASGYGSSINPSGFWISSTFDHLGRVTQITMPRGDDNNSLTTTAQSSYEGVFTTVTDQAGKVRRQKVDALGRMIRLDEPDSSSGTLGSTGSPNQATSYDYDALDNLVHISQPGPNSITQHRYFKYDSLSRLIRERQVEQAINSSYNLSDSLTGNNTWSRKIDYNSSGLVTDSYDARGVHTQMAYDALNRLTQITYSDGTPTAHYYYDSDLQSVPSGHPTYTPTNSNGRLIAMTYGSGATGNYFNYDAAGRATSQWQVTGSTPTTYSLSYSYNLAGLLTSETYPSGRVLSYAYDEGGRLAEAKDPATTYANALSYVAHGGLKSETWGNGAVHSLEYNRRLQPSEVKLKQSASGAELQRYNYSYGQVTQSTGSIDTSKNNGQIGRIDGFINGAGTKEWDQRLSYDELGRLKTAAEYQQGSSLTWSQQYTYDRWGNRFQSGSGNSGAAYEPVVSSDVDAATNRFIASGTKPTTYDDAGNVTIDTRFRNLKYEYDANGRQTAVKLTNETDVQSAVYDCAGQRVQTTASGVTRQMVYDIFGQQVADYSGGALQRENIYRGGQLLSVIETPTATPPTSVAAVPSGIISAPTITVSWSGSATNYRVERKGASGSYTLVGTTASTSLIDSGVSNGSAYLFKVCAADGAGNCTSSFSNLALGTAVRFTDDPLITFAENPSTATSMKSVHITQLRTAVNAVRSLAGLGNASWTNEAATGDLIYAADVSDLRTALDLALTTLNIPTSAYTDNQLAGAPNGTTIKRAHIAELRERATSGVVGSGGGGASNVSWTSVSSTIQATGNSLMKVSGTNDWNAGAVSTQTISGDGYVEFTAGNTITWRMCGLGNGDSSVNYTDIEYAFYLEGSGNLHIYESGNYRGQYGTYTGTDHLKVAVEGGVVKYYRNSTLVYTSTVAPQYPLLVDASLNTVNTSFYELTNVVIAATGSAASNVRYVLSDVQGSSRAVMNNNGAGASTVVARHDYLPFGQELGSLTGLRTGTQGYGASDTNRQKYGLTERDDTTGLDHTWWRKYENTAGRWTSPDPLAGSIADPQSFNRYAYTQNDPVNFIDPTGLGAEGGGGMCYLAATGTYWDYKDGTRITIIKSTEWRCIGGNGGGRGGAGITPQNSGLPTGQLSLNKILNLMDISKTRELMCHRDVIDAMKRAWSRTQNGTSGNEAGFVLNGNPKNYQIVDTKSGNTQGSQEFKINTGGANRTFLLFHIHPNRSSRFPSTPDNNVLSNDKGDTGVANQYNLQFLVGHRSGLTLYDPQVGKPIDLRQNVDWMKQCK